MTITFLSFKLSPFSFVYKEDNAIRLAVKQKLDPKIIRKQFGCLKTIKNLDFTIFKEISANKARIPSKAN